MTEAVKHTPTPWIEVRPDEYAGAAWLSIYVPQTNEYLLDQNPVEMHATTHDYDFIKLACNSHYDLLEALKALSSINENHGPFGGELYRDRVDRAWDNARAAIAKAEGRS